MSTHTVGPWELDGSRRVLGKAFDGSCKSIVDQVRGGSPAEADANARLIAAAPDLLVAARAAYKLIEAMMPGVRNIALQDYAALNNTPVALARAIAKASGS